MSAAKRPDPARVALRDQLAAAERGTFDLNAAFRFTAGGDHIGLAAVEGLTGPVAGILRKFETHSSGPGFRWCKHLRPEAPAPAVWMPWHPDRLYCVPCSVSLPPLTSKEDRRCDSCGKIYATITPGQIVAPARELPQRPGKPPEARPATTIDFGLCDRCLSAARAAQAESERAHARPFRLPPAGRPVIGPEAEAFRLAVMFAQAQGDPGWLSGAFQTLAERAAESGNSPAQILWATCALITVIGTALVKFTDNQMPRAFLWDEIERDVSRLAGMSRDPRAKPEAAISESLERECLRALELVRRFDAGEAAEAIAGVPDAEVMLTLSGACYLLRSIVPTVVLFGLAFPEAEVWSGILASIDAWEAGVPPSGGCVPG